MTIIGHLREMLYQPEINRRLRIYADSKDPVIRSQWQLNQFNSNWKLVIQNVPYYQNLFIRKQVPAFFESWEQFFACMPVTDRNIFQSYQHEMTDGSKKRSFLRITGGSSGTPIHMPAWNDEIKFTRPNQWVGRSWSGIRPSDRCFFLWGHAHLFGSGIPGQLNKNIRNIKDSLLGYYRFPVYNLSAAFMEQAVEKLLWFKPAYIIGYAGALELFARAALKYSEAFQTLKLKAVLASGENFHSADGMQMISEIFHAPVIMEYGSVETGAVAYTNCLDQYQVFWQEYLTEVDREDNTGRTKLRITSLYPRCFPLIRYDLGDYVDLGEQRVSFPSCIYEFDAITSRMLAIIKLSDNSLINVETINHAVRTFREVLGFQVFVKGSEITLHLLITVAELSPQMQSEIKVRLSIVHPLLASISIKKVDQLQQTIAGKTPLVVWAT